MEFVWLLSCGLAATGIVTGLVCPLCRFCWPVSFALTILAVLLAFACRSRYFGYAAIALAALAIGGRAASGRVEAIRAEIDRGGGFRDEVFEVLAEGCAGRSRTTSFMTERRGLPIRVVCRLGEDQDQPRVGEIWACSGWLNGGEMSNLAAERIFWAVSDRSDCHRVSSAPICSLRSLASRARREFSERLGWGLEYDPEAANLNRAILLGERGMLDYGARRKFAAAGALHIFAISGLHVMVVARLIACLLIFTLLPVRFHGAVSIPLIWGYVLMTGAAPSAVRAGLMATFTFSASFFWRRPNWVIAWAATFLLIYFTDPWKFFDVGCAFSFAVMLSLVLFGRLAERFRNPAAEWILPSFAAWAAGVPIAAHVFGRMTPGGLLANVLLLPLAGANVTIQSLGLLVSFLWRSPAEHLNNLSALLTRGMSGVSALVAEIPGGDVELEPWGFGMCASWYVALVLTYILGQMVAKRRRLEL